LSEFRDLPVSEWKPTVARHWSRDASGYNKWVLRCLRSKAYRRPFESLFLSTFGTRPLNILDVGTGPGVMAFILAELGHRVTAIDLAPGMLDQARSNAQRLNLSVDFQQGDAEVLSFPQASFDGLISRLVLWNLPNPAKALTEWARVLKPGGKLLIIDADVHRVRKTWWHRPWHIASAPLVMLTEGRNPLLHKMSKEDLEKLPLAHVQRPDWEIARLGQLGLHSLRIENISRHGLGWLEFLKYGCWGDYVSISGQKS
jgi:ubiquinone/menaquinone biosynthesis C-methylase UbiE